MEVGKNLFVAITILYIFQSMSESSNIDMIPNAVLLKVEPVHIEMLIHDLDIISGVVGQHKMNSWRSARWPVDGFKLPANKLNLGMEITSFSTGHGDMHGFNSLLSHYIASTRVYIIVFLGFQSYPATRQARQCPDHWWRNGAG